MDPVRPIVQSPQYQAGKQPSLVFLKDVFFIAKNKESFQLLGSYATFFRERIYVVHRIYVTPITKIITLDRLSDDFKE